MIIRPQRFIWSLSFVAISVLVWILASNLASVAAGVPLDPLSPNAAPDLIIERIEYSPAHPDVGQSVDITITIKNQGDAATGVGFRTYLYIDPPVEPPNASTSDTSYTYHFGLNPNESYKWAFTGHTFTTSGTHSIWGWVDKANVVSESDETNNLSHTTILVGQVSDGNDTCQQAQSVPTDGAIQHHELNPVGDKDWFKFEATGGVRYIIEAVNVGSDADVILELHNACPSPPGFGGGQRIEWIAPVDGTYYVMVEHHDDTYNPSQSAYDLSITAQNDPCIGYYEPNNTCAASGDILTTGVVQHHSFCRAGDIDWVRFQGVAGTTYVIEGFNPGPDADVLLELHNSCNAPPGLGSGARIEWTCPADGVYYVKALNHDPDRYGAGAAYDLRVTFQATCQPDNFEVDNTPALASNLAVDGSAQMHNTCPAGDVDWVRFPATAGVTYTLETLNPATQADTYLCLYQSDGATQLMCDDDSGPAKASRIIWQAPVSGDYLLQVRHYRPEVAGPDTQYDLAVRTGICREDNYEQDDTQSAAQSISTNGTPQAHNFCPTEDADWVRFQANANTNYVIRTLELGPEADTVLYLFNAAGNQLAVNDDYDGGTASRISYRIIDAGEYYVKVQNYDLARFGSGTEYKLAISAGTPPPPSAPLPPTGLASPSQTSASIELTWSASENATSYDVYRSAVLVGNTALTRFTDTGLQPNTTYTYTVRAKNAAGVSNPSAPLAVRTGTGSQPSGIRTLILVNRARISSVYGEANAANLMTKLQQLGSHAAVQGEVLQIENNAAVANAYAAWTSDILDTNKTNAVAAAIRGVVMDYLNSHTQVEYIVIVGGDWIIPFRRVPDRTRHPESNYAGASRNTTIGAACKDNMTLTDDYYADREPVSWGGQEFYIPDYAIGRLVETPTEMIGVIDTFLASHQINDVRALVTGYDFVQDAANAMCDALGADLGNVNVDCSLIGDSWSGNAFKQKQLEANPPFRLQAINGHANHFTEGAPLSSNVTANDVVNATADLSRAILYTVGCHSGMNVPPENSTFPLDLTQAFAQRKVNYVANTGFGWGIRGAIGLSEKLMVNYTDKLLQGTSQSIGPALTAAKQLYYQQAQNLSAYDEKILIEATLYGLPHYVLNTGGTMQQMAPANAFPSVLITASLPLSFGGLQQGTIEVGLPAALDAFDLQTTIDGSFYTLDGFGHAVAGEPIQPYFFAPLPSQAGPLRGVVLRSAEYQDQSGFDPVIAAPTNEYTGTDEPNFAWGGWYPPVPYDVRYTGLMTGAASTLVTLMGQFDSRTGSERLFDRLDFDLYYSLDSDQELAEINTFQGVQNPETGMADFKVKATDSSGIHSVIVAYSENNGTWHSLELDYDATVKGWVGSVSASSSALFYIQVVDGAGNVTIETNKGAYYKLGRKAYVLDDTSRVYLPLVLK